MLLLDHLVLFVNYFPISLIFFRGAATLGCVFEFQSLHQSYHRHYPGGGLQYILDMNLILKKFTAKKKTLPVQKRSYIQVAI